MTNAHEQYIRGDYKGPLGKAEMFISHEVILHIHQTKCMHCGQTHKNTVPYLVQLHPTSAVRRLVPLENKPLPQGLRVGTSTLKLRTTPVCHQCVDTFTPTVAPQHATEAGWREALRREHAGLRAPKPKPKSKPTTNNLSLADLGFAPTKDSN